MNTDKALAKILDYIKENPNSTARDIAKGIDPKGHSYTAGKVGKCLYPAVCNGKVERVLDPSFNIYCYSIRGDC